MGVTEWGILAFGGALLIWQVFIPHLQKLKVDFFTSINNLYLNMLALFSNWKFYAISFIIALPFLIYLNYKLHVGLYLKKQHKQEEAKNNQDRLDSIDQDLHTDLEELSSDKLSELIPQIDSHITWLEYSFKHEEYLERLYKKRAEAKRMKVIAMHKEKVSELKHEEYDLKENIRELERQKEQREHDEHQEKQDILNDLSAHDNPIFRREDLSDKEVAALLDSGYSRVNEFCPYELRVVTVLVKPHLNHSTTHTFLVSSVQRILETFPGVRSVQEHITKDADLTWMYDKKVYALEIETGTLLKKKEQLQQKIAHLKRKYPGRWIFVVSHRDLVPEYRKYGSTVTRKDVRKGLERLLKSHTQKKQVSSDLPRREKAEN